MTTDLAPTVSATRRTVQPRQCRRCRAIVLVGLDGDRAGFPVAVDPTPITHAGELWCLVHPIGQRYTYMLFNQELTMRDSHALRRPISIRHINAVPEHWCNQPVPPQFHAPVAVTNAILDEPPF